MRKIVTSIALSLGIVACGGGGGGSGDGGAAPIITSSNYVTVAQEALSSIQYVVTSGDILKGSTPASGLQSRLVIARFARSRLSQLTTWAGASPQQASAGTQTQRVPCDSGWMDVTANDANGNGLPDAGDSFTMVMSDCRFGSDTLSGTMSLTINSVSGDLNSNVYSMAASMSFANLRSASLTTSTAGSGSLGMTVASRGPNDSTTTITLPSFTTASTTANVTQSVTLTNLTVAEVVVPAGAGSSSSLTVNGGFSSSSINNNTLTITTASPFVQSGAENYPASGQLIFSDATNRKVRVTVLNSTSLTIEVDAGANGSYDLPVTKLWSDFV